MLVESMNNDVLILLQPVKQEKPWEGDSSLKEVIFERTPVMSTYLVAFVVGEYDFVEAVDANGVKVRVYTPPQKQEQGLFALEVSDNRFFQNPDCKLFFLWMFCEIQGSLNL